MVYFKEFEDCCNRDDLKDKRKVVDAETLAALFLELRDLLKPWSQKEERMMNTMITWFFFRPDVVPRQPQTLCIEDGIARHWREEAEKTKRRH